MPIGASPVPAPPATWSKSRRTEPALRSIAASSERRVKDGSAIRPSRLRSIAAVGNLLLPDVLAWQTPGYRQGCGKLSVRGSNAVLGLGFFIIAIVAGVL